MLPFLMGGKSKPETGAQVERDATLDKVNIPDYAGEEVSPSSPEGMREFWKARGGGVVDRPVDRRTMQTPVQGGDALARQQAVALGKTAEVQMQEKLGINPQAEPAAAPPGVRQGFGKGGFGSTAKPRNGPRLPVTFVDNGTPAVQAGPPKFG